MNELEFLRSYANRPQADREAFNAAFRAFETGQSTLATLDRRIAAALCLTVNTHTESDDCDCPSYSLDTWAMDAIDGKFYRRKSGPDVRLAFAMGNGMILEVRPSYRTNAEYLANFRRLCPGMEPFLNSDSNWQAAFGYRLFVYHHPAARMPQYRGFFGGYGQSVWTDGPQAVTDAATETLWRVHRNHAEAFMGMPFCGVCRRALTDDTSRALGIGPDCARLLGIPHARPPARAAKVANEKACTGVEPMQAGNNVSQPMEASHNG